MSMTLLLGQSIPAIGNPTGGNVVAGAATMGSTGKTLTINQSSNDAIINWQSFSIATGETTKFILPSSSGATLNRVVGGNPSAIYGTLSSNGSLFLINPSGILVGAGGRIDTNGFLGSTLNVSDDAFLKGGGLTLSGASTATVDNEGTITAGNGGVYLVANQVTNGGAITTAHGSVGLAAGTDVLFQPVGDQHLFVQANPAGTTRAVGVTNAGSIQAASAELRAAGGNAYALAINNSGSIAATGYKKVNGQVYLTADTGLITNSGKISAINAKGHGGNVQVLSSTGTITNTGVVDVSGHGSKAKGGTATLKAMGGVVDNSAGTVLAQGGQGGAGGVIDLSGDVKLGGTINTLAPGGKTGMFILDPTNILIAPTGGDETGAQVGDSLDSSNTTLEATDGIIINDSITWTSTNTLTLQTDGGTPQNGIQINSPISGVNGGLVINAQPNGGTLTPVSTSTGGTINVSSFILTNGAWSQNFSSLPTFIASNDFEVNTDNGATFLRVQGGNGSTGTLSAPYTIVDVYGLQGMDSLSNQGYAWQLGGNIDASSTTTWNSGTGFVPIGTANLGGGGFVGSLSGGDHTITGLYESSLTNVAGLFSAIEQGSTVSNLTLSGVNITGGNAGAGGLAGSNSGTIDTVTVNGAISGPIDVGGLVGFNDGLIEGSSSSGTVTGTGTSTSSSLGGLVGTNYTATSGSLTSTGTITSSSSSATVTVLSNPAFTVGGLVGENSAVISDSTSSGSVTIPGSSMQSDSIGGLVGLNDSGGTITSSASSSAVTTTGADNVGGLVGENDGLIASSYSIGLVNSSDVAGSSFSYDIGGLVGRNTGTIDTASYSSDVLTAVDSNAVGGLVGNNSGTISASYSAGSVNASELSGSSYSVGGLVGYNIGSIDSTSYSLSPVTTADTYGVGGLVGYNYNGGTINGAYATGTMNVTNGYNIGGLVGDNSGVITGGYSTSAITGTVSGESSLTSVGGVVGFNEGPQDNTFTGTVTSSYFTGSLYVRDGTNIGGLVGENDGSVSNSYTVNSASITALAASEYVGGLVGLNNGTLGTSQNAAPLTVSECSGVGGVVGLNGPTGSIMTSSNSASVTPTAQVDSSNYVGGFAGENNGTIISGSNTGSVTQSFAEQVGGFVGFNSGTISLSSNTGPVEGGGSSYLGGFVGYEDGGTIETSYNTGTVSNSSAGNFLGGFVGYQAGGTITQSYANAPVVAGSSSYVGGFAGYLDSSSTISNSFSLGAVSGTYTVGGFVGNNYGTVQTSYSIGSVSAGSNGGGFAGSNTGTFADCYFSTDGSGYAFGVGNNQGGTITMSGATVTDVAARTTAQLQMQSTYDSAWNFSTIWTTNGNSTTPELQALPTFPQPGGSGGSDILSGVAYTDGGVNFAPDTEIELIFDGQVIATGTTTSNGDFSFDVTSADVGSGLLLTEPTYKGDTYFQSNSSATTFSDADIYGSNLRVVADNASNALLKAVTGTLTGNGINYSVTGAHLTTGSNIGFLVVNNYTIDGDVTASGNLTTANTATLTGSADATLTGYSATIGGMINDTNALNITTTTGAIEIDNVGTAETPATAGSMVLNSAGPINISMSNLAIGGDFSATGTGNPIDTTILSPEDGIVIFQSALSSSGGNISLNGTGSYSTVSSGTIEQIRAGEGVFIEASSNGQSTLSTTGSGNISIDGTFAQDVTSTQNAIGAIQLGASGGGTTVVSVVNGTILLNGSVSSGSTQFNFPASGVNIQPGASLIASGSGNINITGNTSGSTSFASGNIGAENYGIDMEGSLQVNSGSLTLHGTAGDVDSSATTATEEPFPASTAGVYISGSLITGNNAAVSITGTGGSALTTGEAAGQSVGVYQASGASFGFGTNNSVTMTGTGGAVNGGTSDDAPDAQTRGILLTATTMVGDGSDVTITGTGGSLDISQADPVTGAYAPASKGVSVGGMSAQAEIFLSGDANLNITGHGGNVTAGSNSVGASIGVNIGTEQGAGASLLSESGSITISGTAGSAPSKGIGVLVEGLDGSTADITSPLITIIGTGGSGYAGTGIVSGNYIPNYGVAVIDGATISGPDTDLALNVHGIGGANSPGVALVNLSNDSALESTPATPTILAGTGTAANVTLLSTTGAVALDGEISGNDITITSPDTISITDSSGGTAITANFLTAQAANTVYVTGIVQLDGASTISSTNGDINLGGQIIENGTDSTLVLAAATASPHSGAFVNSSELDGEAVEVNNGSHYVIYSDATGLALGGLTPENMANTPNYPGPATTVNTLYTYGTGTMSGGTDTLTGVAYSDAGFTLAPGTVVDLLFDGQVIATGTTSTDGDFSFSVSSTEVGGGLLLTEPSYKGDTFFLSNNTSTTAFSGLDIYGQTLRILGTSASNAILRQTTGSITGSGVNFAVNAGNLSTTSDVGIEIGADTYTLDGNVTANGGGLLIDASTALTGSVNSTLSGSTLTNYGTFNDSGTLTFASTAGDLVFSGVGAASEGGAVAASVVLNSAGGLTIANSTLSTVGDFSATGHGDTGATTGQADGIYILDSSITSQGGNINLTGTGGYGINSGPGPEVSGITPLIDGIPTFGFGVAIYSDQANTTLSTSGSGNITIHGTVDQNIASSTFFSGVEIDGSESDVNLSVENGNLSIVGSVANGTSTDPAVSDGVFLNETTALSATGSGNISISGSTVGARSLAGNPNNGVYSVGVIQVNTGTLSIHGSAGTADTLDYDPESGAATPSSVGVEENGQITAGSGATVLISGTGGAVVTTDGYTGFSIGVDLDTASSLTLGTNNTLTINGTGGAVNAGNGNDAGDAATTGVRLAGSVQIDNSGSVLVNGTGGSLNISHAQTVTGSDIPLSRGVLIDGSGGDVTLAAAGSTPLTIIGTGGNVTAGADKIGGSVGIQVGGTSGSAVSVTTEEGMLKLSGRAGTAPSDGIGLLLTGLDGTSVNVSGPTVFLDGIGGAGYTGTGTTVGNYIPNSGVAIADNVEVGNFNPMNLTINGTAGARSPGIGIVNLSGDSALESNPSSPTIQAGTGEGSSATLNSVGGPLHINGYISASSLTINSDGALDIADDSDPGSALFSGPLDVVAAGPITINAGITTVGPATIESKGGDVTLNASGQVVEAGEGNTLVIAAGTTLPHSHYFINHSESGADAVQAVNGSNYIIYSADPYGDVFNGVTPETTAYEQTFPASSTPEGNAALFYAAEGEKGPNPVGSINPPVNGNGSGGTTTGTTTASGSDGSGSNNVPPTIVPQLQDVTTPSQVLATIFGGSVINGFTFGGQGNGDQSAFNYGGLANNSGTSGEVEPGDSAQLGGGELNNVHNPAAAAALSLALGPAVENLLSQAMAQLGDYAFNGNGGGGDNDGTPPGAGPVTTTTTATGGKETILGSGGEVEIGGGAVNTNVPPAVKKLLQKALGDDVKNGMSGH